MFSQVCVKNSVQGGVCGRGACVAWEYGVHGNGGMHGRGCARQGACMAGGMCGGGMHGRECVWQGGMHGRGYVWQQGACMAGDRCGRVCAWQWGMHGRRGHAWQEMATAADSTHPTGMHSCSNYFHTLTKLISPSLETVFASTSHSSSQSISHVWPNMSDIALVCHTH